MKLAIFLLLALPHVFAEDVPQCSTVETAVGPLPLECGKEGAPSFTDLKENDFLLSLKKEEGPENSLEARTFDLREEGQAFSITEDNIWHSSNDKDENVKNGESVFCKDPNDNLAAFLKVKDSSLSCDALYGFTYLQGKNLRCCQGFVRKIKNSNDHREALKSEFEKTLKNTNFAQSKCKGKVVVVGECEMKASGGGSFARGNATTETKEEPFGLLLGCKEENEDLPVATTNPPVDEPKIINEKPDSPSVSDKPAPIAPPSTEPAPFDGPALASIGTAVPATPEVASPKFGAPAPAMAPFVVATPKPIPKKVVTIGVPTSITEPKIGHYLGNGWKKNAKKRWHRRRHKGSSMKAPSEVACGFECTPDRGVSLNYYGSEEVYKRSTRMIYQSNQESSLIGITSQEDYYRRISSGILIWY